MSIQTDNIESFLIGLRELSIDHNILLDSGNCYSDNPGISKLPEDYEKRFYVLMINHNEDEDFNDLYFMTQEEVDYWIDKHWINKEDAIIGKLK